MSGDFQQDWTTGPTTVNKTPSEVEYKERIRSRRIKKRFWLTVILVGILICCWEMRFWILHYL